MSGKGIYTCGPMEDVSRKTMNSWRAEVDHVFKNFDIKILHPTRRASIHEIGDQSTNVQRSIVKMDLQDIADTSVILADLRDSSGGKRWGSVCEIAHAHTKHKTIIVVMDPEQKNHPFITFYATEIYRDMSEAIEACKKYFE
jgi:hypothetical protein